MYAPRSWKMHICCDFLEFLLDSFTRRACTQIDKMLQIRKQSLQGMYVSGGWDRTLRLWFEPPGRQAHTQQRRGPWADWGALPSSAASQARTGEPFCRA